jgi:CBS domain-containing protein
MVKVKEIMKKYVVTADPDISISNAAKIMTNNRIGSVVLVKSEKPVGIVTSEDITTVVARGMDPKKVRARDLKKRRFIYASPEDEILKVTRKMVKNGVKRLPIIKNKKLVGMVSDKEILSTSPELIDILSEKLKARIERVASPMEPISGICENCEAYSDELRNVGGRWLCEGCRQG